jgi:hypothetical protein
LQRHCDDAGTDFERIERTCAFAFPPDDGRVATDELIDQLSWLAALGIDTVIGRLDGDDRRANVEHLACRVVPAVENLGRHLGRHEPPPVVDNERPRKDQP